MPSKPYQGHPSWAHWNVSLWLSSDEPLYRMARAAIAQSGNLEEAARLLKAQLPASTPDGAPYALTYIRRALANIRD